MLKQSILLIAAWSSCGLSALAADYPPPYDAVYEQSTAGQTSSSEIISDGKGKMKSISSTPGGKIESTVDYPAKMTTTVMHTQHMWMKTPLAEVYKDETALKKEAKSLGAKTFNGHPCHGYETTGPNGVSQTWIGDDSHVMVHFEMNTGKVKSVTDLKSYSAKAGDVSLAIPTDCKEFKMPVAH